MPIYDKSLVYALNAIEKGNYTGIEKVPSFTLKLVAKMAGDLFDIDIEIVFN